jgi:hypothetical protein
MLNAALMSVVMQSVLVPFAKGLPRTNTVAYIASLSVTESFLMLESKCKSSPSHIFQHFTLFIYKLECLSLPSLIFMSKALTHPNGWFTLVRYRRQFRIKHAGLVMKFFLNVLA